MSWVHIDDAVNLIVASLKQSKMRGVYNSTAPNPVRMREMCSTLGSVLSRPSWLPVPEFALKVRSGNQSAARANGCTIGCCARKFGSMQTNAGESTDACKNALRLPVRGCKVAGTARRGCDSGCRWSTRFAAARAEGRLSVLLRHCGGGVVGCSEVNKWRPCWFGRQAPMLRTSARGECWAIRVIESRHSLPCDSTCLC